MADVHLTRTQAEALIQPEISREIIKDIPEQSAALKLMRRSGSAILSAKSGLRPKAN